MGVEGILVSTENEESLIGFCFQNKELAIVNLPVSSGYIAAAFYIKL